jgi:serine/threonine protein kinase
MTARLVDMEQSRMSSAILKPGSRLGKYEVVAHIATGGMANVYKAVDTELRRTVALKVLLRRLADREADLERFNREARLAARLSHKHIVTLFESVVDPENGLHYLALEFIDGEDLGQYIERKGRLQPEDARRILIQATKALNHAFSKGVVHRDIKPSNFLMALVGKKVVVKLTDLGLGLVQGADDYQLTRDGTTVGTVDYMSPEQARDSRATDIRSDIYSLGCTGFHMLAGKPPYFEGGLGERVYKHMYEAPPDVREFSPTVSSKFWAVLQKMMAKNPEERYPTPAHLLRALSRTSAKATHESSGESSLTDSSHKTTALITNATPASLPASPSAESALAPSSGQIRPALVTPDQARKAAAFYERAKQVIAEGGGEEYTRELLANCIKMDPFNVAYHKTLREVNCKASSGVFGRLFGSLNVLAIKSKLRMARSSGDLRKVLELGEEILARQPADADTHLEMAGVAEELGLQELARWCLEQGHEQAPDNTALLRALARQYELTKEWKRAIALWEKVRKLEPDDHDVKRKLSDLSVEDHITRRHYDR